MRKQLANFRSGGMVLVLIGLMLSACAPAALAQPLYAPPCHPPNVEGNVYRQEVQSVLGAYYSNAFNNPMDAQLYVSMQNEAMNLLATQTKRWSDSIDIPLGSKNIRITITYISPELVQTLILNHYLFRRNGSFNNGSFNSQVLSQMEIIANRNEHLFFMTLTSSSYEQNTSFGDHVIVQLPLQTLILTNSANTQVIPQHDDHNLEERIDLTFEPAHGFFSIPLAVTVNGNCEFLLDKTNNAHLVLSIQHITINNTTYQTEPWVIDYAPPLSLALDPNPIETKLQVARDPNHFCPCFDPPVTITPVDAEYWENLARFIWHTMTLDP